MIHLSFIKNTPQIILAPQESFIPLTRFNKKILHMKTILYLCGRRLDSLVLLSGMEPVQT